MAPFTALLLLCLVTFAAAARNSVFNPMLEDTITEHIAEFNAQLGRFEFRNETRPAPRKTLSKGEGVPVSVTFYNQPGMDCTTGNGMCGYGNDVHGTAMGGGGPFLETSLSPLHCASGNFGLLGGCGACGVLKYKGKSRGFVVTDITDHLDDLNSGRGQHIDLCLPSFNWFTDGSAGDGSRGGIFTGHWTRVDCSCMGAPNYPDSAIVARTQAWNQWAKAIVISRVGGGGEIQSVNFVTRNGGFTAGARVNGWGAWWAPTASLAGQGGCSVQITTTHGERLETKDFPLPDYKEWGTGHVYNIYQNVKSAC